ncbi:MAG: hypothetical protein V4683_17825 [Bacteroidota bacterium]
MQIRSVGIGGKPAKSITQSDSYFLQLGLSALVEFDRLKELYQLFPNEAESLKTYLKKEKLSTKK